MPRGGRRPGAGRPRGDKRVRTTVYLDPLQVEMLDEVSAGEACDRSTAAGKLVARGWWAWRREHGMEEHELARGLRGDGGAGWE